MIRNLVLLILTVFSLSFAQMSWRPEPGRMLSIGIIGFLYMVLAFLLFSIIFCGIYLLIVRKRDDKEKKE